MKKHFTSPYWKCLLFLFLGFGCGEETAQLTVTLPVITTESITNITQTSAESGGNVTSDGNATVTSRGIVWGTATGPTVSLTTNVSSGTGKGKFSGSIANLTPNNTYYVRAYAINKVGTVYGNEVSFKTQAVIAPVVTTSGAASAITSSSASVDGNVTSSGGGEVTARGIAYGETTSPTISGSKTSSGSGLGAFSSSITGLKANTKYYARAYATNAAGTSYGTEINFTTLAGLPSITTSAILNVLTTTATGGGNVTSDGGASVTARGIVWSLSSQPTTSSSKTTDGSGTGTFSSSMSGLSANTKYYVRAYATNSIGTAYGEEATFTTAQIPYLKITSISPATNATQVEIDQQIVVTFSANLDAATVPGFNVYDRNAQIFGSISVSGNKITFTPTSPLTEYQEPYEISIPSSIRASDGMVPDFSATVKSKFTTVALSEKYYYSIRNSVSSESLYPESLSNQISQEGFGNGVLDYQQWRVRQYASGYGIQSRTKGTFIEAGVPNDNLPIVMANPASLSPLALYSGQIFNFERVNQTDFKLRIKNGSFFLDWAFVTLDMRTSVDAARQWWFFTRREKI
jgi:hypothetical protein